MGAPTLGSLIHRYFFGILTLLAECSCYMNGHWSPVWLVVVRATPPSVQAASHGEEGYKTAKRLFWTFCVVACPGRGLHTFRRLGMPCCTRWDEVRAPLHFPLATAFLGQALYFFRRLLMYLGDRCPSNMDIWPKRNAATRRCKDVLKSSQQVEEGIPSC